MLKNKLNIILECLSRRMKYSFTYIILVFFDRFNDNFSKDFLIGKVTVFSFTVLLHIQKIV